MYCSQCGKSYDQQVNFCSACGAALFVCSAANRKLQRSRKDRKIAGVCAGFADYLDVDSTLIRVVWLMTALFIGWGFLAYFIAWIVMPEQPVGQEAPVKAPAGQQATAQI